MRDPYKVYLQPNGKFAVVDTRDNPDLSGFIAQTTSSWKKLATAGQRRYFNINHNIHDGHTYLLSYGRKDCIAVNPSKGDYVPPGFDRVSRKLGELFSGWDGTRAVQRARLLPMPGCSLINETLALGRRGHSSVYRHNPHVDYIPGWIMSHNNQNSYYSYVDLDEDEGVKALDARHPVIITQSVCKESLTNSSIRVLVEGTTSQVMMGAHRLTSMGTVDGVTTWGVDLEEPLEEDSNLTLVIGTSYIKSVRLAND